MASNSRDASWILPDILANDQEAVYNAKRPVWWEYLLDFMSVLGSCSVLYLPIIFIYVFLHLCFLFVWILDIVANEKQTIYNGKHPVWWKYLVEFMSVLGFCCLLLSIIFIYVFVHLCFLFIWILDILANDQEAVYNGERPVWWSVKGSGGFYVRAGVLLLFIIFIFVYHLCIYICLYRFYFFYSLIDFAI